MTPNRLNARNLCLEAIARGEPLAWFEQLYSTADQDPTKIPWADLEPNPNLVRWHQTSGYCIRGRRCLKIGCGLGDDCEYLREAGGRVTGIDISPAAVAWCKRRHPRSSVQYVEQDLFAAPDQWHGGFEFVLESYTLQVLPPTLRPSAMAAIARFVAKEGTLLVIARGRDEDEPAGQMPWPLTKGELNTFTDHGLTLAGCEDYMDGESPPVRRLVARFKRA